MRAGDLNVRERWARGAGFDIPPDRRISGRAGSARAGEYSHHHHAHEEREGELSQEAKVGEQPPDVELARHQGPVEVEVPQIDQAELREERAREARGAPRLAHGRERVVPVAGARRGRHGVGGSSSTRASQCGEVPFHRPTRPGCSLHDLQSTKKSARTRVSASGTRAPRARGAGACARRASSSAPSISSRRRRVERRRAMGHTATRRGGAPRRSPQEAPSGRGGIRSARTTTQLRFRLASGCRR